MDNYLDTVQLALEQLGTLRASDEREVEEHKARLTRRAGYLIHQKNPNIGLLKKETGNQVMGMSVDLIIDRTTGDFADVATDVDDGDGFRRIAAQFLPNHDAGLVPRWVCPTASMAGLAEDPHQDPDPQHDSGDEAHDTTRFDAIDARLSSIEATLRKNTRTLEEVLEGVKKTLAALQQ
jgi:hypothetical protein